MLSFYHIFIYLVHEYQIAEHCNQLRRTTRRWWYIHRKSVHVICVDSQLGYDKQTQRQNIDSWTSRMITISREELEMIIPDARDRDILVGIYTGTIKCVRDIRQNVEEPESDDVIARLFDLNMFIKVRKGLLTLTTSGNVLGKLYAGLQA